LSKKIRYGMVGGGQDAFIGAVHRISARLDDQYELVCGAFSSDSERSKRSGLELHLAPERCYADYEAMFAAESELPAEQRMQCVVIVTPNYLHYPVASAAVAQGFHVISDKPATLNLDECRQLAKQLATSNCLYALTHPYASYPMVLEARARAAAGELGNIRKVIVEYTQGWLAEPIEQQGQKQASWRTDVTKSGASCCMGDIGVHAFNLTEFVSGLQVSRLSAELNTLVEGRTLDDDGTALLKFNNGASGVLIASQICVGEENNLRLRIFGDKGSLDWRQEEPNSLWLKYLDRPTQLLRTGNVGIGERSLENTRIPAGHPEGYLEAFANIYTNFATQLRSHIAGDFEESDAYPGIQEALRGMAFIETAVASQQQGNCWLDMPALNQD
jgi:predicted dehydrogenase